MAPVKAYVDWFRFFFRLLISDLGFEQIARCDLTITVMKCDADANLDVSLSKMDGGGYATLQHC